MAEQRTYAILTTGISAAQSFAFYLTERNRHKRLRWTGRALVGLRTEEHARLAACKSQIGLRGPARNCSAFQGLDQLSGVVAAYFVLPVGGGSCRHLNHAISSSSLGPVSPNSWTTPLNCSHLAFDLGPMSLRKRRIVKYSYFRLNQRSLFCTVLKPFNPDGPFAIRAVDDLHHGCLRCHSSYATLSSCKSVPFGCPAVSTGWDN